MSEVSFSDLLQRLGQGDEQAARELVERYEGEIRRAVRVRLTDPRLRRLVDSVDVCQSVFANFFVRVQVGQYDLQQSQDLAALLASMARNKLLDYVRRLHADKRDQRRVDGGGDPRLYELPASAAGPDELAERRDLVAAVLRQLDDDERRLADLRAAGLGWDEISNQVGAAPDALRKQLRRALDRATRALGLEELPP